MAAISNFSGTTNEDKSLRVSIQHVTVRCTRHCSFARGISVNLTLPRLVSDFRRDNIISGESFERGRLGIASVRSETMLKV